MTQIQFNLNIEDLKYAEMNSDLGTNGVSTRKVKNIVQQLCGESFSKSFVSSLTEKLDPIVNTWASRTLNTMYYPYIFADVM